MRRENKCKKIILSIFIILFPFSISNSIENFGIVSKGIYRGSELKTPQEYQYLHDVLRVDIIINLNTKKDNPEFCKKYNLNCVQYPIHLFPLSDIFFDWTTLRQAFRFIIRARQAKEHIYIHCKHGSDRTGALVSLVMVRDRACELTFNKNRLWKEIDMNLKNYKFHSIYIFLHRQIQNSIFDFEKNQWICEKI
jgi:protein tyrosine/serine phosphatase